MLKRVVALFVFSAICVSAQRVTLRVDNIDPPNWFAHLPAPMLLVRGEGLSGASFSVSDSALHVEKTAVSENGHWAQVFLAGSPARAETVQITVSRGPERVKVPYTFSPRRAEGDGMAGFSPRDLLYLIMTDRFADGDLSNDGPDAKSAASSAEAMAERAKARGWHGGDIPGVKDHLGYLADLGATAVWLTPVYANIGEPQSYHGYGATDLYAVDPHYGTLGDLQALGKALHARGMKLVLDMVPNHVGPAHPWVQDEPTPVWFHGTALQHREAETNFRALINPHAPERDRDETLHGWFANTLPDMDTDDAVVAQYLRQNTVWWIEETGADALRIDTFSYVNRGFWNGFNGELKTLFPHLTEVGEVFNGDPEITSAFAGGNTQAGEDTRLYTPFDFPTFFAIRNVFVKGEPMSKLADVLSRDELYPHPERLVPFVGNHDTTRFAEEVKTPALRELAFEYLMTTRGMPQIYSGDELAMGGGGDPENRHDFPGGFPQSPGDAFTAAARTPEQQELFTTVQGLAALRRAHPTLACGAEQVLATGQDLLAYVRYGTAGCPEDPIAAPERLLVVLQRGSLSPIHMKVDETVLAGCKAGEPLIGKAEVTLADGELTLVPQTAFVVLPCR